MTNTELDKLLQKAFPEPSAALHERGRQLAAAALALARLRPEFEKVGFQPLSLGSYIEGLARRAEVGLEALLRWADVRSWDEVTTPGIARFCRELGMSLREAMAFCRMSLAEAAGFPPLSLQATLSRGLQAPVDPLTVCEDALDTIESRYDAGNRHLRLSVERELRKAFHL